MAGIPGADDDMNVVTGPLAKGLSLELDQAFADSVAHARILMANTHGQIDDAADAENQVMAGIGMIETALKLALPMLDGAIESDKLDPGASLVVAKRINRVTSRLSSCRG